MSDLLGIAQKVRHVLILVPKTAMTSWQKLSGKSMEPNVASFVVISIGLGFYKEMRYFERMY